MFTHISVCMMGGIEGCLGYLEFKVFSQIARVGIFSLLVFVFLFCILQSLDWSFEIAINGVKTVES